MSEMDNNKKLLLELIGSLTLADNLGDVAEDLDFVCKRLKLKNRVCFIEGSNDLQSELHSMGIKTLYGSKLSE